MGREQAKEAARKSEKCFVGQSGQVELTIAAVSPQPGFPPLSTHTTPARRQCWTHRHGLGHVMKSSPLLHAQPRSQATFAADSGSLSPPLSPEKMCLNLYPTRHSWGMCISANTAH